MGLCDRRRGEGVRPRLVCSVVRSCFHELHSSFHAGLLGERLKQSLGAVAVLRRRCSPDPHSPLRLALATCLKRERLLSSWRRRQQAYSTITTAPWPKPNRAALGSMRTTPTLFARLTWLSTRSGSTGSAQPLDREILAYGQQETVG